MLNKAYDPHEIEKKWYSHWENAGYFTPTGVGEPYCIMIPPPNVTGSLHMGHAFQQTLMDILIRYHRMLGRNTLWQVGTDHAGIATQMIVERQLLALGEDRHQLGREAFVKRIWQWKSESGNQITQQLRRIGASVDWSRERFTLDEGLSSAVQQVFISLYEEGLIYRGQRLVNWDPELLTAVSDLEVENEETKGVLWYIRYPLEKKIDDRDALIVATTRPETLLGDVAVAVHPEDERYQKHIGNRLKLPLTDRSIPIIADKEVDPKFGTGCVKITPAHDFNDFLMGERHHLPKINIFTKDAKLNEEVPKQYRGLDRFDARKQILQDLDDLRLLAREEAHTLNIPRGDRSNAILEPLLTDQWFLKMDSLAKPAIQAVEAGNIRFIPNEWSKTYFQWLNNIQDWCISRQLWWGHRIPAWYDQQGNIYVGRDVESIRKQHHLPDNFSLTQDEDVLDTWFSSALWPFSTLGWPAQTNDFKTFYPTQTLITGFDIIFFWVARMIMFGLKFTNEIPFKDVYINGIILDQNGQKMSKTKGNVIDPLDLIDGIDLDSLVKKRCAKLMQPQLEEKIVKDTRKQFPEGIPSFGTDALRFSFASLATQSRYIRFDLTRIQGDRHFCNKIWNAARFLHMNVPTSDSIQGERENSIADRWILSLWQQVKLELKKQLEDYRFDLAAKSLYEFTWYEFCDWYLEFSKPILNPNANTNANINPNINTNKSESESSESKARGSRYTLVFVFEELMRVLHPFMPFMTEEIWQSLKPLTQKTHDSIMIEPYPEYDDQMIDNEALSEIQWVKAFILELRKIRSEMKISPGKEIPVLLNQGNESDHKRVQKHEALLKTLAKIHSLQWIKPNEPKPNASIGIVGNLELLIPMSDLIDSKAEIERLEKELQKINKEIEKCQLKLSNTSFIENAPEAVIKQEKDRIEGFVFTRAKLQEKLDSFLITINK